MRDREAKEIDGLRFTVQQLPGMRGVKALNRVGRALGPAFAAGLAGVMQVADVKGGLKTLKLGNLGDMDVAKLGPALERMIATLFQNLSDDELEWMINEFTSQATVVVNGNEVVLDRAVFDEVMRGRAGTVFKLLGFAFRVNYGSFSSALGDLVRPYMATALAQSSSEGSPKTSPTAGPAGG